MGHWDDTVMPVFVPESMLGKFSVRFGICWLILCLFSGLIFSFIQLCSRKCVIEYLATQWRKTLTLNIQNRYFNLSHALFYKISNFPDATHIDNPYVPRMQFVHT
jgi:ABC-type uncharacterized transport system fused permease/ATPase subunit